MKTRELRKHITENNLKKCYLLYGEEPYLTSYFENELRKAALAEGLESMNQNIFSGKEAAAVIIDACETPPFMSGRRFVLVKDSGFFGAGRKNEAAELCGYLERMPKNGLTLVFSETEADKRGSLYKKLCSEGYAAEFKRQSENELADWLENVFKKNKAEVSRAAIYYIVRTVGLEMNNLFSEAEKLTAYARNGDEITEAVINALCVKSLETRIFELIGGASAKNAEKALIVFENLMADKESPLMVLSMIARQVRLMLQCEGLRAVCPPNEIAARLGAHPFAVSQCLKQAANFTREFLTGFLYECLNADYSIKTGKIGDKLALELLIVRMAG